jgi:two-component system cell cycle response regulator DivK
MDIQLPDISGLAVARLLKEHEAVKSIPIIAVTAFAVEGNKERMLSGGFDAFISKPISVSSSMQTVESLVADGGAVQQTVH